MKLDIMIMIHIFLQYVLCVCLVSTSQLQETIFALIAPWAHTKVDLRKPRALIAAVAHITHKPLQYLLAYVTFVQQDIIQMLAVRTAMRVDLENIVLLHLRVIAQTAAQASTLQLQGPQFRQHVLTASQENTLQHLGLLPVLIVLGTHTLQHSGPLLLPPAQLVHRAK